MTNKKQVIGNPLEIGGRVLSLSRAIRAGDFPGFKAFRIEAVAHRPLQSGA